MYFFSNHNGLLFLTMLIRELLTLPLQVNKPQLFGACWMIQYLYFGSQFFTVLCLMWTFYIMRYKKKSIDADKIRKPVDSYSVEKKRKYGVKNLKKKVGDIHVNRTVAPQGVCYVIANNQVKELFSFTTYYSAVYIFDAEHFQEYKKFPIHLLEHTQSTKK
ncbi:hypothetical protein PR048_001006 [Dryococelus australis]|uniref:Uncharacterized protein n=1 Tax=Dryococelus australis TaxID=614101 RepID=A0ABQ9IG70_9NEOP|nr:hypothetical protein PR048_001006 [Dryococelus australis]